MLFDAMMRYFLGALLGAVAACSNSSAGSSEIDGPISYRSTGGFTGAGDGTPETHIDANGVATRARMGGGMESTMLDAATLEDLHDKVLAAQFSELEPMYSCECADDFVHDVTVQIEAKTYNVKTDYGAMPPERLVVVIDALRDISRAPLDWR
jgi:hypothetical protein